MVVVSISDFFRVLESIAKISLAYLMFIVMDSNLFVHIIEFECDET